MAVYYDEENEEMVFEVEEDDEASQAYLDLLLQTAREKGTSIGNNQPIAKYAIRGVGAYV